MLQFFSLTSLLLAIYSALSLVGSSTSASPYRQPHRLHGYVDGTLVDSFPGNHLLYRLPACTVAGTILGIWKSCEQSNVKSLHGLADTN